MAVGVAEDTAAARLKELGCNYMQADYNGPALDPEQSIQRCGVHQN